MDEDTPMLINISRYGTHIYVLYSVYSWATETPAKEKTKTRNIRNSKIKQDVSESYHGTMIFR